MKAWLKGGIITVFVVALLVVIAGLIFSISMPFIIPNADFPKCPFEYSNSFYSCFAIPLIVAMFPSSIIFSLFSLGISTGSMFIGIGISVIFWFVIGAIIGLIIGKIRDRKQVQDKNVGVAK